MEISVELTFSPLQDDFEEKTYYSINLKNLGASGLTILENPPLVLKYSDLLIR